MSSEYEKIFQEVIDSTRIRIAEAAATVARLYGAPKEAIDAILRLRTLEYAKKNRKRTK